MIKKIITAFNKIDLENSGAVFKDLRADKTVMISARNGTGLEELLEVLKEAAKEGKRIVEKTFSYNEAAKVNEIHKTGQIIEEEYRNEGIYIKAQVPKEYMYMFENPVK